MNKLYLNILYGLLLGESFILNNNKEIKLIIKIEGKHISYMKNIHKNISELGYCEPKLPVIIKKLGKKGKLNKLMLLHTYNTNNYLELYNKWYVDKFVKIIPNDLYFYFNDISLAYWLMTEGKISNNKLYVNMNQFSDKDIKFFIQFLENKFRLDKINLSNNFLEFNSKNINKIYDITKPNIFPSMKFKFIT
jgi:hypothetical protein